MAPEWRMEQPVCLIESDDKGALRVNPQAVKILEAIAQPVVVVAVVGLYRTGKSYLMNALAGQRKGFSLGSTVQSHTKGIWMWCLPHPHRAGHALVLLDSEGLGDAHKGNPKHDAWIFTLAILLSSTLVYNSKGTIDQDALSKLHFMSELSEHIKVKADKANEEEEETSANIEYLSFFPSFIWTVRDFTLELELEGRQVTEDEYLESTLMLKKGRGKEVFNYNLPRQCIRDYFPARKCFVFVQPASDSDVKQLESLPDSALQPEFLEQSRRFCQYVLQESKVKMLKGGHPVTGRMLGLLAQSYMETILSRKVIFLEDAVTTIAAKQNEAVVREGLALYVTQMKEKVTFLAEVAALSKTHGACERAALQLFMQQSFKDEGQKYQEQLALAINEHYSAVLGRNRTASQETCQALLSQLSADVERKLSEGVYMQPGGYQLYVTDQRQVLESFQREPNKGVMAEQVLQQFMDSKKVEAASILRSDKMLSEAEKHRAADQARMEQLEQQRKAEEERRQQLEQQIRDLEHSQQLEAKMKEEAERLKHQRLLVANLQSQMKADEELMERQRQHEQEEKERQRQHEQEEKERQHQHEREEKERQHQHEREEKEREHQHETEVKERRHQYEEFKRQLEREENEKQRKCKERQQEQKEKERQHQWEELLHQFKREEKERQCQWEREEKERQRQKEDLLCQQERGEKERQRTWEREEKEWQHQWEKGEKERQRQWERGENERQHQWEREEKEWQHQWETGEKERQHHWERGENERQCQWERGEKERQHQWEKEEKERHHQHEREEKERQCQREKEMKERQHQYEEHQWERKENKRQRQQEREEKERQRQQEREEKERQRQQEREENEGQRQWEREEKERQSQEEEHQYECEAKERERQRQHELELERLKVTREQVTLTGGPGHLMVLTQKEILSALC